MINFSLPLQLLPHILVLLITVWSFKQSSFLRGKGDLKRRRNLAMANNLWLNIIPGLIPTFVSSWNRNRVLNDLLCEWIRKQRTALFRARNLNYTKAKIANPFLTRIYHIWCLCLSFCGSLVQPFSLDLFPIPYVFIYLHYNWPNGNLIRISSLRILRSAIQQQRLANKLLLLLVFNCLQVKSSVVHSFSLSATEST